MFELTQIYFIQDGQSLEIIRNMSSAEENKFLCNDRDRNSPRKVSHFQRKAPF